MSWCATLVAMPLRSKSSVVVPRYQPRFSSPRSCVAGTRTSSKKTSLKSWLFGMLTSGRTVMPGRLHVEEEVADALVLRRVRVGAGDEDAHVGAVRAGRPDLLAVDDVVVAVADGARLEAGEVGAGAGLAEALAPGIFAADDPRQRRVLLLLRAVDDDRRAGPAVADAAGPRGSPPRELLAEDELLLHAQSAAAVLLRPRRGAPAALVQLRRPAAHELHEFWRDAPGSAVEEAPLRGPLPDGRRELGVEEAAHFASELALAVGIVEIHDGPPQACCWPPRR